ncbi:MAG: hypothetical protein ACJ72D_20695 [Marmoricola sp.]
MKADRAPDGSVVLTLSHEETVVLHEAIAFSEWSNDLDAIEISEPVERKVISDLQQSLAPMIPELGGDGYGATLRRARSSIDPSPF